jgi:hypothetical protein
MVTHKSEARNPKSETNANDHNSNDKNIPRLTAHNIEASSHVHITSCGN